MGFRIAKAYLRSSKKRSRSRTAKHKLHVKAARQAHISRRNAPKGPL